MSEDTAEIFSLIFCFNPLDSFLRTWFLFVFTHCFSQLSAFRAYNAGFSCNSLKILFSKSQRVTCQDLLLVVYFHWVIYYGLIWKLPQWTVLPVHCHLWGSSFATWDKDETADDRKKCSVLTITPVTLSSPRC